MVSWTDSLLIGIPQLDDEHRKLLSSADRLLDACRQGKSKEDIAHILYFTVSYAKEHFRDEENLQERYSYPGINAHKRNHAQFNMQTTALVKEYEITGPNVALTEKLHKALVDWLINHISTEDKKLGEYLNKNKTVGG